MTLPPYEVSDEDRGPGDPPERAQDAVDVALGAVEAVLGGDHLIPVGPKRGDQLAKARAIGPEAMAEDDARLVLRGHTGPFVGRV